MYYEKIITRENGDKVKIIISFFILGLDKPTYKLRLFICPKGKRKYNELTFDSFSYRKLTMEERKEFEYQTILKYITEEDIYQVKLEAWHKLIPIKGEYF